MNIAALVLGIVGITGWVLLVMHEALAFVPMTCSILAIVFGVLGRRMARKASAKTGLATAGLVLGIVTVVIVPLIGLFFWYISGSTEVDLQEVYLQKHQEIPKQVIPALPNKP